MSGSPNALRRVLANPFAAIVIVALAWWIAVPLFKIEPRFLPPISVVFADGMSVWRDLAAGLWRTLLETVLGFLAGAILGIAFGVGFAYLRFLERAFFPIFVALQTVPVIAFGAIVVIWFGNTIMAKVVIALYLAFFPVAVNTLRGLETTDPQRIALMKSFGASGLQLFLKLALPTALPSIMIGLKLGISLSLAGAIVGEWFGDTVGLGVMLLQSLYFEQIPRVWVLIVACGALGTVLYGFLALIERRFVWWRPD
ncbi:ABC transporter permease [Kaistia dalseonensis]|uniref:NitT/TauT family transport system permease protein n=1 Tax=Kaistia dalseonensis TaxID=410840 RepID=A0ABU0HAH6_9HYPH|nr:ABC transporter permease [Kaistia dalseonensis]MCX5496689.1 ABC transporter permease [Kaistia dalseonensis]MDQ0439314.1 NitT/TauT family transport system permease protein [Kaistia dalseonensis]